MKKIINLLMVLTLLLTSIFTFTACGKKEDEKDSNDTNYTVALNEYNIELGVGETFTIVPKKFNGNGKEVKKDKVTYVVEATEIASVDKNGVITAKQIGGTYINVNIDGQEVACFVSVKTAETNGLVILFSGKIYQGMSFQAHAYVYENGVRVGEPEQVTFSGSDNAKATVTASGLLTGVKVCDDFVITATCEYNGKTYTASKTVSINAPYYYVLSNSLIKLATTKTLSGADNQKFASKDGISLSKVSFLNNADSEVIKNFTATVNDETVATVSIDNNGTIKANAKSVCGTTAVKINLANENVELIAKVEVYNAISTVADMDVLGYASLLNAGLLSENYVLVNDIDYQGQVLLPIASIKASGSTKRVVGNQWQYWLKKTETGYEPVPRANISSTNGLSTAEFAIFESKGINPTSTPFSGVFDGNGYSIKNAEIFYGSYMISSAKVTSEYAGVFGYMTGALKNVSFENLSIQDVDEWLNQGFKFCADSIELNKDEGVYLHRGTSIVAKADSCEISNVYANINYNHKYSDNYCQAVLSVEMLNMCKVSNCVIEASGYTGSYAIDSSFSSEVGAITKNCLAIGVWRFSKKNSDKIGVDGNFFLSNTASWKSLAGTKDSDNQTAKDVANATFDKNVWDLSKFNSTDGGRPELIKGCIFA